MRHAGGQPATPVDVLLQWDEWISKRQKTYSQIAQEAGLPHGNIVKDRLRRFRKAMEKSGLALAGADELVAKEKSRIIQRHAERVANQLAGQKALTELLVEAVESAAKKAPPFDWKPAPSVIVRQEVEEIPNQLLGDTHVGQLVRAEEVGGLNQYDMGKMRSRLGRLKQLLLQAIDLHRREAKIRHLTIWMLGDMIEGEVIFDGQAHRIQLIVVDQLFEAANILMEFLLDILASGLVEEIHCICLPGNHGRTTHRIGASRIHSNWDYVLYKHMAAVLRDINRIKWFIPSTWFAIAELFGKWRIFGTHGDPIKSWLGIPFYGLQRHDSRTTTLMQLADLYYHYMVYGHFHAPTTLPRVVGAQIINGSIVGGSDFSMHRLGTATQPIQTLFAINERWGRTWQYDFVLEQYDPTQVRKELPLVQVG